MDVLLVCKPSGRNAMAIFLILASFVALSVIWAYEGIEDPVCLWMLLLSVPMTVLFFFFIPVSICWGGAVRNRRQGLCHTCCQKISVPEGLAYSFGRHCGDKV